MTKQTEGALAIVAALFVLLSAMLDPRISVVIALIGFIGYALYKFAGERAENA